MGWDVGHAPHNNRGGESSMRKKELGRTESGGGDLQEQSEQQWQTPATDQQARLAWPSPTAGDARGSGSRNLPGSDAHPGVSLTDATEREAWITPNSRDWKSETGSENNNYDRNPNLSRQVVAEGWPTPTVPAPHDSKESVGSLRKTRDGYGLELANAAILYSLQDQQTGTDGAAYSPSAPNSSQPDRGSIGSAMDCETLVYFQWAQRAWLRQGRLRSSATGSAADLSESTSDDPSPEIEDEDEPPARDTAREKKQKKLWAYRQRVMGWQNPMTWTRTSFRRKLNANFVDALMSWPPSWTSVQAVCGPEVMELWRSKVAWHLQNLCGDRA